jgi:hypothetical protein
MPSPDTSSTGSSFIGGIILFVIVLAIFQLFSSGSYMNYIIYIAIPIIVYIVSAMQNLMYQYSSCGSIDAGKAFLGAVPSIGVTYIFLFLAWIPTMRVIVSSVTAPLLISNLDDLTTRPTYGGSRMRNARRYVGGMQATLEDVEKENPLIKGFSYGFYLFFAMLYSGVIGAGLSANC